MPTRENGTRTLTPHEAAPSWVWHAWLCHDADPDGAQGEPCPDNCEGSYVDPVRARLVRRMRTTTEIEQDKRIAHLI